MPWNSIKLFPGQLIVGAVVLGAICSVSWGVAIVLIGGAGLVVRLAGGGTGLTWELMFSATNRVAVVVLCLAASFLVGKLVTETEE